MYLQYNPKYSCSILSKLKSAGLDSVQNAILFCYCFFKGNTQLNVVCLLICFKADEENKMLAQKSTA